MGRRTLIFTCEHGGNQIPREYKKLFANSERFLKSHRGWDPGALKVAQHLADKLNKKLFASETSRLLIDLNRTPSEPTAFSKRVSKLSAQTREQILNKYYFPFRKSVHACIKKNTFTTHISMHSFTPVMRGVKRECEVGLLFDPARPNEKKMANQLANSLSRSLPKIRIRMNYPYKGTDDGHTTTLRQEFSDRRYAGLEIEMNQGWIKNARNLNALAAALTDAIAEINT